MSNPFQADKIQLVIFDCDGVLVDTEPTSNQVFARHIRDILGLNWSIEDTIARLVGRSMASCTQILESEIGKPVPENFIANMQAETFETFKTQGVAAIPGVVDLFRSFRARGLPFCVASSGGFDKMAITLNLAGLWPWVEGRIFSASQVARGKPHPDLFLFAAEKMGFAPNQCAVIEDSAPGVQAAVAAGMQAIAYAPHDRADEFEKLGAICITNMAELENLI